MSPVALSRISVNGKQAEECNILKKNGNAVGVRLGAISADDPVTIETDFKLTGDFASLMTAEPSLQVQVFEAERGGEIMSQPVSIIVSAQSPSNAIRSHNHPVLGIWKLIVPFWAVWR